MIFHVMETLVVVAQQKKQYYYITRSQGLDRFHSAPSKNLREVICSYSEGILHRYSEGILHRAISIQQPSAPISPSSNLTSPKSNVPSPGSKSTLKGSPISISVKSVSDRKSLNNDFFDDSLSFSERWAGPTYSNSPPPSSLPMPKFLQQPKRTLSLDLPYTFSADAITLHPTSKSAPASPTGRECSPHGNRDLFCSADSATKALCRILNLDLDDE